MNAESARDLAELKRRLATQLATFDRLEPDAFRDTFVLQAVALARRCGYPAGITIDPERPDTPIAVIELPGRRQVHWALGPYREAVEHLAPGEQAARIETFARTVGR